jgi:hypothetical protein
MGTAAVTSPIFANLDSLVALASEHGVDVNPTLLRVATDIYLQKPAHSADEERQFVALALRLLDAVDDETHGVVARKLLAYPALPAAVAARLANGRLHDADDTAARDNMPGAGEPEAAESADAVGAQSIDLGDAFLAADAGERRRILARLPAVSATPGPSPSRALAAVRQLEDFVLSNRPGEFIRELERALGLPRTIAQAVVNDNSGEPLVVSAKALSMPIEVLQRVLLLVNPAIGHSVRRVFDLSALYAEITPAQAFQLVASWRGHAAARTSALRPFMRAGSALDGSRLRERESNGNDLGARVAATPAARSAADRPPLRGAFQRTTWSRK